MTWNGSTLMGNKLKFTEVDASTLTIPGNSITKDKITGLNTSLGNLSNDIGTLNSNVSNLSSNIANLNTSVSDLGNIETIARAWAQSSSPPDPNNASSKSSKTWASRSEEWAQGDGLPGGVGTLSAMGWSIAAGSAAGTATGAAGTAAGYAAAAFNSAEALQHLHLVQMNQKAMQQGIEIKLKTGLNQDYRLTLLMQMQKVQKLGQKNQKIGQKALQNQVGKILKVLNRGQKNQKNGLKALRPGGQDTKSSKSWAVI